MIKSPKITKKQKTKSDESNGTRFMLWLSARNPSNTTISDYTLEFDSLGSKLSKTALQRAFPSGVT